MGEKSGIEWTDDTWNPTTGCDRVSPGCANCYAATQAPRLKAMTIARGVTDPTAPYMRDGDPKTSGVGFGLMVHEDRLTIPLRKTKARRYFVNSMSDLFHPEVPDEFIDRVWAVMALAPQHTFQILTKRPERMREYVEGASGRVADAAIAMRRERGDHDPVVPLPHVKPGHAWWLLPNVWLGTSVENARWRTRIDDLRQTPAAVRFLSCEPLLGSLTVRTLTNIRHVRSVDLMGDGTMQAHVEGDVGPGLDLSGIHWVIVGGESGSGARPMDEGWVRDIVAACRAQGAAPFVKQMGDVWSRQNLGHPGHGGDIATFAEDLRVREYPAAR